jgi:hypothetical protein
MGCSLSFVSWDVGWFDREEVEFGMNETGAATGLDGHARASSRALQAKATRAAAELVVSR